VGREYVGIDLHRRRSVIYRMDETGAEISCTRVASQPEELVQAMAEVPGGADVVLESTFGWYWAVDLLQELGFTVHLSNPYGNDWGHRRVKNDERDARDLADLCRLGRLAEAWIAPSYVRELRELVRFRAKLGQLRTGLKAQVQAVMGKHAVLPVRVNMWGTTGQAQLDALELPPAYTHRLTVLRELVKTYDAKIAEIDREVHAILRDDVGYNALQSIFGIGRCSPPSSSPRSVT